MTSPAPEKDASPGSPDAPPSGKPRRRRGVWWKKLLAVLFGLLLAAVVAEIALRLVWHNPYAHELPDKVVKIRVSHADSDHYVDRRLIDPEHPRARLRTDGRGYIRPSFQHPNPDATVAFLGGSTTQCSAVMEENRFPALVSTLLQARGLRVNTLNAAYSGNTTHDALNILLNHVAQDAPDYAVLFHAANDVGVLAQDGNYHSRMGEPVGLGGLAKWAVQWGSGRCYLLGMARHLPIIFHPLKPADAGPPQWRNDPDKTRDIPLDQYFARLRAFVHLCRDLGIEPVLMTQPLSGMQNSLTPDWADLGAQDACNAMIRQIGREEGALVIDLALHLQDDVPDWDQPMNVFYDGMHVTDKGSRVFAEYIAGQLEPKIRQRLAEKNAAR